jgi:hypothetical protein
MKIFLHKALKMSGLVLNILTSTRGRDLLLTAVVIYITAGVKSFSIIALVYA